VAPTREVGAYASFKKLASGKFAPNLVILSYVTVVDFFRRMQRAKTAFKLIAKTDAKKSFISQ
jgi:hypothetical protein